MGPDTDDEAAQDAGCPMECRHCDTPGDCEDCLDCLYWPLDHVDETPKDAPILRGHAVPLMTEALASARTRLTTARRVGLLLRDYRRRHGMSQRALAEQLGWSRAAVGRMEVDASALKLTTVEALLAHTGHRLAIIDAVGSQETVPSEVADEAWGAAELVARDAAGRRLPPYGRALFRLEMDRIQDEGIVGHRQPWVWRQPG